MPWPEGQKSPVSVKQCTIKSDVYVYLRLFTV